MRYKLIRIILIYPFRLSKPIVDDATRDQFHFIVKRRSTAILR